MEGMDRSGKEEGDHLDSGAQEGTEEREGAGMEPNVGGRSSRALDARLKTLDYRPEKVRLHSFIPLLITHLTNIC